MQPSAARLRNLLKFVDTIQLLENIQGLNVKQPASSQ
jgi:hypothetical protein